MSTPRPSRRLLALDALRGIAVFLMIEQHVGIWLWHGPGPGERQLDYPLLVGFNALGGMAAPLFVSLAGVGSALFVAAGRPRTDVTLVRRGLVLMLFGLALNFLTPSWFSWGSWFVLHMMGFAMALAPVWRRLPTPVLLLGCACVLISTVAVQLWLNTPIPLDNPRMRDTSLPGGPLRLALAEGQFPILPWLCFYLAGFCAGRFIKAERHGRIALLGACFVAVGGGGHLLARAPVAHPWIQRGFELHLGFYPASVAIAGLLLGGALLLIAFVAWLETRRPIADDHPLVTLGRISLTLLMLHVVLFRELSRPIHWWRGLSANAALAVIFGFVILSILASRPWQRVGYRFGAEWLLRKIAG
ncbi:DUF1624 domain-containing protein [Paraliomyxa miuraensis]|nr:DUF418 domain-containing transporter [Paraliomyxa miuraensis]MCX4246103.1 DUF1624 domain-containing protein [Paraliomyxa miuraensis]